MVLINDTKYACQACIKGHRSSSCAHTDRPLFEIKKKGRPPTQCSHCRDLRKKKQIHVKCMCEARGPVILDPSQVAEGSSTSIVSSAKGKGQAKKKKKDITLSAPALPNGLKDVQDLSLVTGLKREEDEKPVSKSAGKEKAKMEAIAQQCLCRVGGECNCFTEKHVSRKNDTNIKPSGQTFDSNSGTGGGCCSSSFSPSTSQDPNLFSTPSPSSSSALSSYSNLPSTPMTLPAPFADYFPSPLATHEPIASLHNNNPPSSSSSRYSSSGQLANRPFPSYHSRASYYTPYPQSSSHSSNRLQVRNPAESVSSASNVANPEEILRRGLKELVGNYVRARMGTSIPLLLGNEGIERPHHNETSEDRAPGSESKPKVEGLPNLSKIYEDAIGDVLMVSTCTCGKDCKCPSCKEHGNYPENGEVGAHIDCPETCSSCFNCSSSVALPANLTTVADLFSASVAMLPPSKPSDSQSMLKRTDLVSSPTNTQFSRDAFESENVPIIKCCDGQCGCPPGECSCMKDCCGCCEKCLGEGTTLDFEAPLNPESDFLTQQATSMTTPLIKPDKTDRHSSCCSTRTDQPSTISTLSPAMQSSSTLSLANHPVPSLTEQPSCCSSSQRASPPLHHPSSSQITLKTNGGENCRSEKNPKTNNAYGIQHPFLNEEATSSFGGAPSGTTSPSSISNPLHTRLSTLNPSHGLATHNPALFSDMHLPTGFKDESESGGKSNSTPSATRLELIDQSGRIQKNESELDVLGGFEFNLDLELAIAATLGDAGYNFGLVQPPIQQQDEPTPSMAFAANTRALPMIPPGYPMDLNAILTSIAAQSDHTNLDHSSFTPSTASSEQIANTASNKPTDFQPTTNIYVDNRLAPPDSRFRQLHALPKASPIHSSSHSSSSVASSNQSLAASSAPPEVSTTPDCVPSTFDLDQYLHQVLNVTHMGNTFSSSITPPPPSGALPPFTPRDGLDLHLSDKSLCSSSDEKMYHHQQNSANRSDSSQGHEYSMSNLRPVEDYRNQTHPQYSHQQPPHPHPHLHQHQQPPSGGSIRFSDGLDFASTDGGQVDWVTLGL